MTPSFLTRSWFLASINLAALLIISVIAFSHNQGMLLAGNDGPNTISMAEIQRLFFGISPHLHSNLFEGIGNISFPFNLSVLPGFWYGVSDPISTVAQAIIYTWFAVQLFLSILLIGYNYRFNTQITYSAAWLLTILAFPYFESFRIYSISANSPEFLSIITIFALMDIGIQHMGMHGWIKSFACGALLLAGIAIGLIICPANMILLVPITLITIAFSLSKAKSRHELIQKLVISILVLLIIASAGWVEYMLGLLLNTAATFFKNDMEPVQPSLIFSSIFFHGTYRGIAMGTWLYCASLLGTSLAIKQSQNLRSLAIIILVAQILAAVVGASLMSLHKPWNGPSPIYFELPLLPFYALFAVYFLHQSTKNISLANYIKKHPIIPYMTIFFVTLIYITSKPLILRQPSNYTLNPTSSPITDILEATIAIHPPMAFAGRVVNILPKTAWTEQFQFFYDLNRNTGNDHQTSGLWLKNIPTLHEYNQVITPGFYRLYRRFLSDGFDTPYRSWSNFNIVNLRILRLLGVRFIISTESVIQETVRRTELSNIPGAKSLYLFELNGSNINGISAKNILITDSIQKAENIIDSKDFDIHTAVVLLPTKDLSFPLEPAIQSKIIYEKGGIHITAQSKAQTLLILPFEYSHCFNVKVLSGKNPKILRTDIALAGILFNRKVDIQLDNRTSPFASPRCRLADYLEFSKLWKKNKINVG